MMVGKGKRKSVKMFPLSIGGEGWGYGMPKTLRILGRGNVFNKGGDQKRQTPKERDIFTVRINQK